MAAAQAHAFSEHNALKEVERLQKQMDCLSWHMKDADVRQNNLERCIGQVENEVTYWKNKYRRLTQRLQSQSMERS